MYRARPGSSRSSANPSAARTLQQRRRCGYGRRCDRPARRSRRRSRANRPAWLRPSAAANSSTSIGGGSTRCPSPKRAAFARDSATSSSGRAPSRAIARNASSQREGAALCAKTTVSRVAPLESPATSRSMPTITWTPACDSAPSRSASGAPGIASRRRPDNGTKRREELREPAQHPRVVAVGAVVVSDEFDRFVQVSRGARGLARDALSGERSRSNRTGSACSHRASCACRSFARCVEMTSARFCRMAGYSGRSGSAARAAAARLRRSPACHRTIQACARRRASPAPPRAPRGSAARLPASGPAMVRERRLHQCAQAITLRVGNWLQSGPGGRYRAPRRRSRGSAERAVAILVAPAAAARAWAHPREAGATTDRFPRMRHAGGRVDHVLERVEVLEIVEIAKPHAHVSGVEASGAPVDHDVSTSSGCVNGSRLRTP